MVGVDDQFVMIEGSDWRPSEIFAKMHELLYFAGGGVADDQAIFSQYHPAALPPQARATLETVISTASLLFHD